MPKIYDDLFLVVDLLLGFLPVSTV